MLHCSFWKLDCWDNFACAPWFSVLVLLGFLFPLGILETKLRSEHVLHPDTRAMTELAVLP